MYPTLKILRIDIKWMIFVLTLFIRSFLYSQDTTISKKQMYDDFDYLEQLIFSTNPYINIKEHLFNYSISDSIHSYRSKIENCTTTAEYQLLIKHALNLCIDGHSVMLSSYSYPEVELSIPLTYFDGNYYIKRSFVFDSIQFIAGSKLIAINGNEEIHSEIENQIPSRYLMRWDNKLKHFYSELFYLSDQYIMEGGISLAFKNHDDTIVHTFKYSENIDLEKFNTIDQRRVEYFEDSKILYIRIPEMRWADRNYFKREITGIEQNKEIDKVVIDVRYNMGGSSIVGRNVFRSILPKPIEINTKMVGNPHLNVAKRYKRTHSFNKIKTIESIKELDNIQLSILSKEKEEIKPFRKSIKHTGDIYIIGNEHIYSAGGAIFMFANLSTEDNIYSIGTSTGWFLGEFTDPIHFKLPNSKLEFMISPSMALTNVYGWNNVMLDNYDFYITPSVENYNLFYSQTGTLYSKEFLMTKDPYFKPVIN